MEQVVDLQKSQQFRSFGIALLSISPDPIVAWKGEATDYGITLPVLTDPNNEVASKYGVMRWAMGSEPGHTFVLIDENGKVVWVQDYGAQENGGLMYVEPRELLSELEPRLS